MLLKCFLNSWQLSLGDAHSYLLSTAENELGVVIATSEAGIWSLMKMFWIHCHFLLFDAKHKILFRFRRYTNIYQVY